MLTVLYCNCKYSNWKRTSAVPAIYSIHTVVVMLYRNHAAQPLCRNCTVIASSRKQIRPASDCASPRANADAGQQRARSTLGHLRAPLGPKRSTNDVGPDNTLSTSWRA